MKVREAENRDSAAIKEFIFSILEENRIRSDPGAADGDLDAVGSRYKDSNGHFFVIEEKKRIVATVGIEKKDDNTCELRRLHVLPSLRGQGIGKRLLERAIQKAREAGYKKMVLGTISTLEAAIALYKKYGFNEYRPERLPYRCDTALQLDLDARRNAPHS